MMIDILSIWIFSNTESLLMLPLTTLDQFLSGMPYVTFSIPGKDVILIQPSSTILVYLLGLIMIAIGVYFLVTKKNQKSSYYWAIGLIVVGHQCNCRRNELSGFRLRIKIPRLGALSVCQ
jgi:cadmium resistance protein CadD (predicted permease)